MRVPLLPRWSDVHSAQAGDTRSGFTLIELLVVMAIIAGLIGLAGPAVSTLMRGSQLTQAAQLLNDQLSLARQVALSKNRTVEVRFYRYGDPETPGENVAQPNTGKFRAMQTFEILDSGQARAMGKMMSLAGPSVIIDSGKTLSTIIGNATGATTWPSKTTGTVLNYPIPRAQLNYEAVAFRFQPDGSTNLPPQSKDQLWFLTVHEMNRGDEMPSPPPNFATIQINPSNGKIRTYHP